MQRRRMGRSGLTVSRFALGTWMWGGVVPSEEARDLLTTYLDAGGDVVDTAHGYSLGESESLIGSMVGDVVSRQDLVICTKAGITRRGEQRIEDTSRRALADQLDTSLRRLRTDHVDLWLVHLWTDSTPVEETVATLQWAVSTGRARYVGVSNYSGWQTGYAAALASQAGSPLVCNQVEYSLLDRTCEDEVVPAAESLGIGLMAYSPLGFGVLTGKYRHGIPADSRGARREFTWFADRYLNEQSRLVVDAVATAATGLDVSLVEVALAWVRDRPGVAAAVLGPRTTAQLRTCLDAERLDLPAELALALSDVSE